MLKVVPKAASKWKTYKTALVGVSLNSRNHTGEAFAGLMHWVGENFERCIIDLSDTLHRYNLINEGHTTADAHKIARAKGSAWLMEHADIIDRMPIPTTIYRWDHWLAHPDFQKNLEEFKIASHTQPDFHDALVRDIYHFNQRWNITPDQITEERFQNCMEYLLEELAVHSILYDKTPCAVVYPGKDHESFSMVRNHMVKDVPSGHLNTHFTRMVVYNFDNMDAGVAVQQQAA